MFRFPAGNTPAGESVVDQIWATPPSTNGSLPVTKLEPAEAKNSAAASQVICAPSSIVSCIYLADATACNELFSGQPAGLVRREKDGNRRDVGDFSGAAQGCLGSKPRFEL